MIRAVAVTIALVRTAGAGWAEPAATETPTIMWALSRGSIRIEWMPGWS